MQDDGNIISEILLVSMETFDIAAFIAFNCKIWQATVSLTFSRGYAKKVLKHELLSCLRLPIRHKGILNSFVLTCHKIDSNENMHSVLKNSPIRYFLRQVVSYFLSILI